MQNVNSVPCRYFGQGNCRRGSRCPYAHIFSPSTSAEASAHHQEEQFGDARSRTLCKFYLLGTCFKGSHCPYRHAIEEADPLRHEDPAVQNDYFRQLTHGSLVQFQEGGSVSDLSVLQDYSAVRIDGLLPRCTRQSVADVLQKHSFDVQLDDVRVVTNLVRGKVSAFVTCRDRSFAGEFRTTSRAADLNEIGSSESEVHVVQPRLPYGTSTKSCRKVVISLGQAPDVARLYFEDQGCAERASQHFESDDPTEATVIERWIVVLRNVHDLDNALAALADQPDFVHLWPANLDHDIEDTPILVESLLTHIGPVVFTMRSKPDTRKFKAVAVFEHDSNALTAVQDLHDQPQECLSYQPLLQQLISSSQLRVASHIFNALREQIDTKIQAWQDQYVTLRTSSKGGSSRRFVVLTIEGPDPKLVADATRAVESILAGKVLVEKGAPLWRPSLMANGAAYRTIQHLRSQYSVCLTLNKVTHQINYFGPEEDHEVVQQAAIERLREFSDSTHIVELDVATFAWTCREGLNLVREVLGEERISVDIASTPKRVIVTGTEEQYDLAKLILGLEQTSISSASEEKESDPDCSVCWTLAEDAVTLECQHVYCLSCFEGLSRQVFSSLVKVKKVAAAKL
ncbi:hypothetical protein LTR09_007512 [Extremus antarcticus]|uniref:C3H1-type domain-containing protein n=1 Tax=Extremus antarcticus TaxID=702011 RepID=A0AAJ0G724_9PEZI|nr:hypothetical protein LTR09_007512 [Extremus antarcticus]